MARIVNFSNFRGGLNSQHNIRTLDITEAADARNIEFTEDGSITKCKGFKRVNLAALNGGLEITGLYEFTISTGTTYLVAMAGDKVYTSVNGINWTEAYSGITPGYHWQGATFFDYAIFINGVDQPLVFDGGSITQATWWTETAKPSLIVVWKNRLWMSGAPLAPSKVWYSAAGTGAGISFDPNPGNGTPFSGNPGGSFAVDLNNGQSITGLSTFYNSIVVYKTKSIYSVSGDSAIGSGGANEFSVTPINQTKGCIAPRSIVNIYNDQFFIDDTGINQLSLSMNQNTYGNVLARNISNKVQNITLGWNPSKLKNAFSIHYENKKQIWFVFPDGSSSKNNKVLILDYADEQQRPWTIREGFTASCGTYYDGKPLLGGYDGFIQQHDTSHSYNGDPIDGYWASSWLDFGNKLINKHLLSIDLTLELVGNYDLTVEIAWDYNEPSSVFTINQRPINASLFGVATFGTSKFSAKQVFQIRRPAGGLGYGKELQIKFKNNNADQPFRIVGFDLVYDMSGIQPRAKTK